jgi:hypothetical protein
MSEFLAVAVLLPFATTVTGLLISGVNSAALAPGSAEPRLGALDATDEQRLDSRAHPLKSSLARTRAS